MSFPESHDTAHFHIALLPVKNKKYNLGFDSLHYHKGGRIHPVKWLKVESERGPVSMPTYAMCVRLTSTLKILKLVFGNKDGGVIGPESRQTARIRRQVYFRPLRLLAKVEPVFPAPQRTTQIFSQKTFGGNPDHVYL